MLCFTCSDKVIDILLYIFCMSTQNAPSKSMYYGSKFVLNKSISAPRAPYN